MTLEIQYQNKLEASKRKILETAEIIEIESTKAKRKYQSRQKMILWKDQ